MEAYKYTRVETRLANLQSSRRLRFLYVDAFSGTFSWSRFPQVLLNTLGNCLNIPVLFFICYYVLTIYPPSVLPPLDLISVQFFAAAMSIFFDFFIGYFNDQMTKPISRNFPKPWLKSLISIIGTVGLVVSLAYLFDYEIENDITQFRTTIMLVIFFLTIANCTTFKNSMNYSPSQDDRRKLHYFEYFLKGLLIFLYVSFPYFVRYWNDECTCGPICAQDNQQAACIACLNTCDTIDNLSYFRTTSIVFTSIFGLANIISQFAVKTRNDEDREDISTTFNRRIIELCTNKLLFRTFFVSVIEFTILFSFALWSSFAISNEMSIQEFCVERWKGNAYLCSKSFWTELTVFVVFVMSAISFILSTKRFFILSISIATSFAILIAGILMILINENQNSTVYITIVILVAIFYASLPATKLIYSDGIFYDEYKSGSTQSHLPSSLFIHTIKIGFLVAFALHLTLLETDVPEGQRIIFDESTLGVIIIVLAIILVAIKIWLNTFNLHAFDKIQIAIERNMSTQNDDIEFLDPISKRSLIRNPVTSFNPIEKKYIKLLYNLHPDTLNLVINGKHDQVKSRSMLRFVLFFLLAIAFTVVLIIFGTYFNTRWSWLMLIGLVLIPVLILAALFQYNVWASVGALESQKYKGLDRSILVRFAQLADETTY